MDKKAFICACEKVLFEERKRYGIGTLGEKSVHAVLKYYFEPDRECHEKKLEGFYADIVNEQGIIEIQSRNFLALKKKLPVFLEKGTVTIVYPIANEKWIVWLDEDTGELSPRRKSPKKGRIYDVLCELYHIKEYLLHPNLQIVLVVMNMEETKLLDGRSSDKKKGATKYDIIPITLLDEIYLKNREDYRILVPEMPEIFNSSDYKKATGLMANKASRCLNVLSRIGVIEKIGKEGRFYLYRCKDKENN